MKENLFYIIEGQLANSYSNGAGYCVKVGLAGAARLDPQYMAETMIENRRNR